jgi:vancomycin permeability regulator SanA
MKIVDLAFAPRRAKPRRFLLLSVAVILVVGIAIFGANRACQRAARGLIYRSVQSVPQNDAALVLGTSKTTARSSANPHFNQRMPRVASEQEEARPTPIS